MRRASQGTNWTVIIALFIAGVAVAGQVGKAPVALPVVRQALDLSLTSAAWIVSIYALFGAVAGLPLGASVVRFGMRRATIGGLALVAIGSALGAFAPNGLALLLSRVVESCGYLTVTVAAPSLIGHFSAERDRSTAMVLWSMFMPVGSSIAMFGGPFLLGYGWREFWMANAIFVFVALIAVWFAVPPRPARDMRDEAPRVKLGEALATPGIALVCAIYTFYVFQYFALVGLMPTYLVEYKGLDVATAGTIVAIMVACNGTGNIIAGLLMRAGAPIWMLLVVAFSSVVVTAPFIYSDFTPLAVIVALSIFTLVLSAMTPGVMWAAIPHFATSAPVVGVGFGLLMQTANIGQLGGASAMGAWVERMGWLAGSVLLIAAGATGVILSLRLRKVERQRARAKI